MPNIRKPRMTDLEGIIATHLQALRSGRTQYLGILKLVTMDVPDEIVNPDNWYVKHNQRPQIDFYGDTGGVPMAFATNESGQRDIVLTPNMGIVGIPKIPDPAFQPAKPIYAPDGSGAIVNRDARVAPLVRQPIEDLATGMIHTKYGSYLAFYPVIQCGFLLPGGEGQGQFAILNWRPDEQGRHCVFLVQCHQQGPTLVIGGQCWFAYGIPIIDTTIRTMPQEDVDWHSGVHQPMGKEAAGMRELAGLKGDPLLENLPR